MKKLIIASFALLLFSCAKEEVFLMSDFGIMPGCKDASGLFQSAMEKIANKKCTKPIVIRFEKGRYDFRENTAFSKELYISNHDQDNPKSVGLFFESFKNLTFDGQGSEFVFHGRMLPFAILNTENCEFKNFSIDFEFPFIAQSVILENKGDSGMIFQLSPCNFRINENQRLELFDGKQTNEVNFGMGFEPETKRILYNTSDLWCDLTGVKSTGVSRILHAPLWRDKRLKPGSVITHRSGRRPTPGIFLSENKNIILKNVNVHYAEGMGVLAQLCENVTLDSLSVSLQKNSSRYFTTQADATHFSGCKGLISVRGGLFENMMDDAINVHGTYLKIVEKIDDKTLLGRYIHPQSWGFKWGEIGDTVQFLRSKTMEIFASQNRISSIEPKDGKLLGAKEFIIRLENALPEFDPADGFGIENLTWTPAVIFENNIVRNNRARGALFSTPKPVVAQNNLFDHTSGTAILFCGDCNGWYETGACRDVLIQNNTFINSLTSLYQFTNAVISIYPEIPNLDEQKLYFHSNVKILNNSFKTFDEPILYAKSVDGLIFANNKIEKTADYQPFHWNKKRFFLEKVVNFKEENNEFPSEN